MVNQTFDPTLEADGVKMNETPRMTLRHPQIIPHLTLRRSILRLRGKSKSSCRRLCGEKSGSSEGGPARFRSPKSRAESGNPKPDSALGLPPSRGKAEKMVGRDRRARPLVANGVRCQRKVRGQRSGFFKSKIHNHQSIRCQKRQRLGHSRPPLPFKIQN